MKLILVSVVVSFNGACLLFFSALHKAIPNPGRKNGFQRKILQICLLNYVFPLPLRSNSHIALIKIAFGRIVVCPRAAQSIR